MNIPSWIIEELIEQAVIQSVEHLPIVQGACSIPKGALQDCFDVIDTLQENTSCVPNDDFFLLDAASRAERPSVSYTKVTSKVAWTSHSM